MRNDPARNLSEIDGRLRAFFALGGGFCVFLVIYASIVPLEFTPLSWQESLERWMAIPWLELGVWERADWITNTLIFIPPTFLLSGYLCSSKHRSLLDKLSAQLILVAVLCALVVGIELIQIWFPPRTVSWNDVVAGIIGVLIGGISWTIIGSYMGVWATNLLHQHDLSTKMAHLTVAAMLAFIVYSIYPFDFVFSLSELEEKREIGRLRVWTEVSVLGWVGMMQSWGVAAMRLLPFGIWLGWRIRSLWAVPLIVLLAVFFEVIQIPIFSKHAAGDEVVAGLIGGLIGWWLVVNSTSWSRVLVDPTAWTLLIIAGSLLIPVLFLGNADGFVTDPQAVSERWNGAFTPPLARYYYTSEYSALSNLGGKLAIFGFLGLCFSGYIHSHRKISKWLPILVGALIAGSLGLFIEVSQVYLAPFVADLTDVGIYLLGYAIGVVAGGWFFADETVSLRDTKQCLDAS